MGAIITTLFPFSCSAFESGDERQREENGRREAAIEKTAAALQPDFKSQSITQTQLEKLKGKKNKKKPDCTTSLSSSLLEALSSPHSSSPLRHLGIVLCQFAPFKVYYLFFENLVTFLLLSSWGFSFFNISILLTLFVAPRLLAAIANDDILPVLNYFKVADGSEPYIATPFTAFICIGCVVLGNLDLISPTITMFFLQCYAGVNLSSFLLDAPSWRPRWRFHHWSFSLLGASLCIVIMFLISWSFTVVSLALVSLIYYYVSLKGKAGDWGDGFKSAYFRLALLSLRSLGANQVHPKNWYPIPLIFCRPWGKLPENVPCHPKLADFANCMRKKG
ncbi:hypothetical protein IFM89_020718 [Coptis chinensis]|uniref:Amino acid permease/ SLC12A domain-containing protein n=1 Tax=Coptis chinensis TaxID=261450 RepID=A0A835H7X5_9MAGN|nr:hypothetical protein IFM89_020718 [Coptis chinensis]